jgi:hypothetical protein
MAAFLHLLKADTPPMALPVIDAHRREPGATVTVVLLPGATAPALSPGVPVRRLVDGDLDYSGLLDLIFAHDHVISW